MMRVAFLFAGQGSQVVGMGADLYDKYEIFRDVYCKVDEILGTSLSDVILNGSEEVLMKTENAQPAILAFSIGCLRILGEHGIFPSAVAGHSLGEYSALVACGVLDFADALKLVRVRGELMERACPRGTGGMAAVLGLGPEQVQALCEEAATRGVVEPANFNCPGQIVIAGETEALDLAESVAYRLGAKRFVRLAVSGPFHSSCMGQAAEEFAGYLDSVKMDDPKIPFISNVTADYVDNAAQIRKLLVEQMSSCVLWEDSMRRLLADGVRTFVEIGPGRVLSSLLKRIDKQVELQNVADCTSLQQTIAFLREAD